MNGEALVKGLGQQPSQEITDQYILIITTIFNFFTKCVKCYFIILLISIPLINDAELLFTFLLPVCIASSVVCPFITFAHFSVICIFLISLRNLLFLIQIIFRLCEIIFLRSMICLFTFFKVSFDKLKFLIFCGTKHTT